MNWQNRSKVLIGESGVTLLGSKSVLVVGLGGVGGYALETLVRSGVGELTVVDGDVFDETNLNRQLLANRDNLGLSKVDAAVLRAKGINPNISVCGIDTRFSAATSDMIFEKKYDYVVDCIDSVTDKVQLIVESHKRNIPCISALGAANRLDTDFVIADIYNTRDDGLARAVRKRLRELDIKSHKVVYSPSPQITGLVLGSMVFSPAVCGILAGREVIMDFLKEKSNEFEIDCTN